MSKLRKSKSLQVYIVEPHNDVVPFIHRSIASKVLPFEDIIIVHFDSHPDLLLPVHLLADVVFKPKELIENLSIENWLLPLTYAKHVNHIVWVKPPWANQIQVSEQNFHIGKCSVSGKMRLSCKENYFMTDGLFCPEKMLIDPKNVRLTVAELCPENWSELTRSDLSSSKNDTIINHTESSCLLSTYQKWGPHLSEALNGKSYILDIDLDFFSTANPFKNLLAAEAEEALRRLYGYSTNNDMTDENLLDFSKRRESQLNQLEQIFLLLNDQYYEKSVDKHAITLEDVNHLNKISQSTLENHQLEEIFSRSATVSLLDPKYRHVNFLQVHQLWLHSR
ncbi:hypothetical protein Btru_068213 [Bulinus truncatus]|nr:hypothetical protein Btru_068213 [Bulinus truncatus]